MVGLLGFSALTAGRNRAWNPESTLKQAGHLLWRLSEKLVSGQHRRDRWSLIVVPFCTIKITLYVPCTNIVVRMARSVQPQARKKWNDGSNVWGSGILEWRWPKRCFACFHLYHQCPRAVWPERGWNRGRGHSPVSEREIKRASCIKTGKSMRYENFLYF